MDMETNDSTLNFLVETIAKALCFESYVATIEVDDIQEVDFLDAMEYYKDHQEIYLKKSFELLNLVKETREISQTIH